MCHAAKYKDVAYSLMIKTFTTMFLFFNLFIILEIAYVLMWVPLKSGVKIICLNGIYAGKSNASFLNVYRYLSLSCRNTFRLSRIIYIRLIIYLVLTIFSCGPKRKGWRIILQSTPSLNATITSSKYGSGFSVTGKGNYFFFKLFLFLLFVQKLFE